MIMIGGPRHWQLVFRAALAAIEMEEAVINNTVGTGDAAKASSLVF
jgi:hypothetical protein